MVVDEDAPARSPDLSGQRVEGVAGVDLPTLGFFQSSWPPKRGLTWVESHWYSSHMIGNSVRFVGCRPSSLNTSEGSSNPISTNRLQFVFLALCSQNGGLKKHRADIVEYRSAVICLQSAKCQPSKFLT